MFYTVVVFILSTAFALAQTYSATYLPSNAPPKTEQGQAGTNQCGGGSDQNSLCQNAYINSVDDFCLFAPPSPGGIIGETERVEVAWCMKSGYGTRLIPDGAIQGAHFVETPDYVQITGVGDLTKLNIAAGDEGGELDPHGEDGNGNPIGGLVFTSSFGNLVQTHEWTNFMAADSFCFRACKSGSRATELCQHIYDVMGCEWNMPGNYNPNIFENCKGDSGEPMGVYGGSTFHQGDPSTPPAHPAPATSQCMLLSTISNGEVVTPAPGPSSTSSVASSKPISTSPSTTASLSTTNSTTTRSGSSSSTNSVSSATTSSAPSPTTPIGTSTANTATSPTGTSSNSNGASFIGPILHPWIGSFGAICVIFLVFL